MITYDRWAWWVNLRLFFKVSRRLEPDSLRLDDTVIERAGQIPLTEILELFGMQNLKNQEDFSI